VEEAVGLIKSAGGKAVLAHPWMFSTYTVAGGTSVKDFEEFFFLLVDLGLSGIETYYPNHAREQTEYFEDLALRCCLWKTAGSDYHGEYKPNCCMSMPEMNYEDFLRFKASRERPKRTIDTSADAFRAMHHSSHMDARESVSPLNRLVLLTSLSYEDFCER
jgi:hypothetical protein